jgi:carbon-monoxide dehydrogenase iron sulfur subunit
MKGIIVVKVDRCVGCKSCEIACAVEHSRSKVLIEAIHEHPAPEARICVEQGNGFATPLQCRQCEDAPCFAICPTHALHRTDRLSPVEIDHELCIGCQLCVLACPFGVIRLDEDSHAIVKCDQCAENLHRGNFPACVISCPTGALEFKNINEVLQEKKEAYLLTIERTAETRE